MKKFIKKIIDSQIKKRSFFGLIFEKIIFDKYNYKEGKRYRRRILSLYLNNLKKYKICLVLAREVGLFSLFFQVIEQLNVCEKFGIKVVVYFNKNSLYWDESAKKESRNVWNYFFKPVSRIELKDVVNVSSMDVENATVDDFSKMVKKNVLVSDLYLHNVVPEFGINEKDRNRICKLIKKYIVVNSKILKKVKDLVKKNFLGYKIIGVQLRGKERYYDLHIAGYGFLGFEYYIREINYYLDKYPKAKIFLASDNNVAVNKMNEIYGEKIILTDSFRSNDALGRVHILKGDRVLGEEALVDCLLLSKCDIFIHGFSNIASGACYFNDKLKHVNVYEKYRINSILEWFTGKERPVDEK